MKRKLVVIIIIIVILFIISSYFSSKYAEDLKSIILIQGIFGQVLYIIIMITAVVIAPFETLPFIPLAVKLWGANQAALFSILGWTIGAMIAFGLARQFGRRFVCRLVNKYDIEEWKGFLPKRNIFWLVVLARFILPVDIISYVIGLFTKMHWASYLLATILGIVPFAFIFAYGSELPIEFQIIAGLFMLIIVIFKFRNFKEYFRGKFKSREL